jgi:predicted glycogen debranching enzyme
MKVSAEDCQNLERALSLEWLEANGRGGYASGTVAGANTRRYHALLLIARNPPVDRYVMVNHLEENLEIAGEPQLLSLSTNLYPSTVHPTGYLKCGGFSAEPWPTWVYEVGRIRVTREIVCPEGSDLVVVRWSLAGKGGPVRLKILPMLSGRDYHALHHENPGLQTHVQMKKGAVTWQPYQDLPTVKALHNGGYEHSPDWYRRVQYPVEQQRGLDCEEDWWSPGTFTFLLTGTQPAQLAFTTGTLTVAEVQEAVRSEHNRRAKTGRGEDNAKRPPTTDPLVHALWQASEVFIADRGRQKTVIAGYPWFTDWGRDTFIALPGLCLVTGRFAVARQIIAAFAGHISEGMVPNRFPDAGEAPEYNTIDASLWFIQAVGRYLTYTGDTTAVKRVAWPAVKAILDGYRQGTRYGIRVETDGLVAGGSQGVQVTWMDAKIGSWVVTPRRGKPVEIQALWVHALAVGEALAGRFGDKAYARRCAEDRARAVDSFRARFWYEDGGYLYDVVDGEQGDDATLRPNQIYAVALSDDLLDKARAQQVVKKVEEELLTPVGLRTLAAADPHYHPRFEGGVISRDMAYHQGTVWPMLLGAFVTAWVKVHGGIPSAPKQARGFFDGLERHLGEACLGQVSEVFDGSPPHQPRGCFAQAWSVAEPLRALVEDVYGFAPDRQAAAAAPSSPPPPPASSPPKKRKRRPAA